MVSIVIPFFNEAESLAILHSEIARVAELTAQTFELIFVDDGSTDGSWQVVTKLTGAYLFEPRPLSEPRPSGSGQPGLTHVHGIRLRRNFGKAAALSAGFAAATGTIIMTLDADLQDDPAEIPNFLLALDLGMDVISGWKKMRHDAWHKVWPSRIFNGMVSWLTGVTLHDHNSGMKCYRAEVFREIRLYGELHRFIPVLAAARGFKVAEVVINHRPRKFGHSKYGVRRFVKGFLDLLTVKFLTGFGQRPQHMLGSIGLLSFALGTLGLLYLGVTWVIRMWQPDLFEPLHQRPLTIYAAVALLLGAQMMSIGFLAELITAYQCRDQDNYSIAETTDDKNESD